MDKRRQIYFQRYAFSDSPLLPVPALEPEISIVIPAFDEPDLVKTLESLFACDLPDVNTEILVVVNFGEDVGGEVRENCLKNHEEVLLLMRKYRSHPLNLFVIEAFDLPKKWAGVGLARKIGMDEAVRRQNNEMSLIVCLDADCLVASNYLTALENFYLHYPKSPGCSLYYEHPLNTPGIAEYELFLRYFTEAQRWCGFPFGFQTVGSSMAARNGAYLKSGGMNRRKAGEDFYFLHKIIAQGDFMDLVSTCVFPSDRYSGRVPFGTGRALTGFRETSVISCYPLSIFVELKKMVLDIPRFYQLEFESLPSYGYYLLQFLLDNDFEKNMVNIKKRSPNLKTFTRHFFSWFDAFRLMKYGNYVLEQTKEPPNVMQEALGLLNAIGRRAKGKDSNDILSCYRELAVSSENQ